MANEIVELERERLGYVNRGLDDRVSQVDALIAKYRAAADEVADEAPADVETADAPPPAEHAVDKPKRGRPPKPKADA